MEILFIPFAHACLISNNVIGWQRESVTGFSFWTVWLLLGQKQY
jgi:hypothetical protein